MSKRGEYGKQIISSNSAYILLISISAVCWTAGYLDNIGFPFINDRYTMPLWEAFCKIIPNKEAAYLIGLACMFGGGFLIHRTNYVLGLIREKTLLPFLFFVLFISTNPDFFPLKPTSPGIFCMVIGLYKLFLSYHDADSMRRSFDWAFLLGIGSLFWIHIVWFVPLFWFGMYHLRALSIKSLLASFWGLATVYWFVLGWCVWTKDFTLFTHSFPTLLHIQWIQMPQDWIEMTGVIYTIVLTFVASMNILAHEYADSLRTREYLSFLIVFAIWAYLMYIVYDHSSEEFLIAACIPSSILIGHFFTVAWNKWVCGLFYFTIATYISILFTRLWIY